MVAQNVSRKGKELNINLSPFYSTSILVLVLVLIPILIRITNPILVLKQKGNITIILIVLLSPASHLEQLELD